MPRVFKKHTEPNVSADDESIPEDLLANIPDLDALEAPAAPTPPAPRAPPTWQEAGAPPAAPAGEVHALLAEARRQMEGVFVKELDRVESTFASLVTEMDARLRAADAQLAHIESERAALEQANAAYQRKFQALKAIADDS